MKNQILGFNGPALVGRLYIRNPLQAMIADLHTFLLSVIHGPPPGHLTKWFASVNLPLLDYSRIGYGMNPTGPAFPEATDRIKKKDSSQCVI
jgi:hypothetical protein